MIHFPSIEQFKGIVQEKKRENSSEETIKFLGTVKLHGSNAAIVLDIETQKVSSQSRNRVLSIENDNAGFARFVQDNLDACHSVLTNAFLLASALTTPATLKKICIFGEWCGSGIQKGVGISNLPRMFCIFDAVAILDDNSSLWLPASLVRRLAACPEKRLFNIYDYAKYEMSIDFAKPSAVQDELNRLTLQVENDCPVAAAMGFPNTIGEGIVWRQFDDDQCKAESPLRFKTKGTLHSGTEKKVAPVSADEPVLGNVADFVNYAVTEARMQQGIDYLREIGLDASKKNLGAFLGWCSKDIVKEETNALEANNLKWKDVTKSVNAAVANWFTNYLD